MTMRDAPSSEAAAATLAKDTAPFEPIAAGRLRALVASFAAAHFSHHVSNSLLNPLLPLIRDSFALSYTQAGILVSAFTISLGLCNAPAGVLADRVGSRPVVVGGLLLTGLISAALAIAGAYWQLLVLLIAMGAIAATYHAPAASLIAQAFPTANRGSAQGLHITGGHLSFFATPVVAATLVATGGSWRDPFLWFAFAPILAGLFIWHVAPRVQQQPDGSPDGTDRLRVFREVWSVARIVGPLVLFSIGFQMFYAAFFAFFTLFLVDAREVPLPVAAALYGVPPLVGLFGAPVGGYLSDRFGRRSVILLGMAVLGPAMYALTITPLELIVLPLSVIGLAAATRQTATEVLVMDSSPPHRRATVLGSYYMLAQELGGFAAPLLGALAGLIGLAAAFSGAALAVTALSAIIVVIHRKL